MKKKSKLFFWVVALVLVFSFTSTAFAKTYDYYETTIKHEDEGDSKLDKLKSHQCYDSNWHCRKNDIKGDKIKYGSMLEF